MDSLSPLSLNLCSIGMGSLGLRNRRVEVWFYLEKFYQIGAKILIFEFFLVIYKCRENQYHLQNGRSQNFDYTDVDRSYRQEKKGQRTEPYGTPVSFDLKPMIKIYCLRPMRNNLNKLFTLPRIPQWSNLHGKILWLTLSKCFWKSTKIPVSTFFIIKCLSDLLSYAYKAIISRMLFPEQKLFFKKKVICFQELVDPCTYYFFVDFVDI